MNMYVKFFLLVAFISQVAWTQNTQKGWEQIAINDFDGAQKSFLSAIESNDLPGEAYLGLSFLETLKDANSEKSYSYYNKFIELSKNPSAIVELLWSFNRNDLSKSDVEKLQNLTALNNPKINAFVNYTLGSYYSSNREYDEAKMFYENNKPIRNWQILGNFENTSKSGFNNNVAALENPQPDHVFTNKYGADVKWFTLNSINTSGWLNFNYYSYVSDSFFYAQTFCESPIEQEVQLRIGITGNIKVWVNDKQVLTEYEERDTKIDHFVVQTKLHKGNNRILVQIGSSDFSDIELYTRMTDISGNPLDNVTFSASYTPFEKETNFNSQVLENASEKIIQNNIKNDPNNILNYLVLGQYYFLETKVEQAKYFFNESLEKFPNNYFLLDHLSGVYSLDDNVTGNSTIVEKMKKEFPDSFYTLFSKYSEELKNKNYDDAEQTFKKIEALNPSELFILLNKIAFAGYKNEMSNIVTLINKAYKKFPDNYSVVNLKYLLEKQLKQNTSYGIKILETYLKKHDSGAATEKLFDDYIEVGQLKKAIPLYEDILKDNPQYLGYIKAIGDAYTTKGEYEKATEYYERASAIAPYIGDFHKKIAISYAERNMQTEAVASFKKAIYYNPTDYDARERLRNLQKEKEIFSYFEQPDVYEIFKNAPDAADFPDDNSIILVDEVQKVLYPEGGSEEKHIILIKIFNTEGVDTWKEYGATSYWNQSLNIEKSEIIKSDGSIIKAQKSGGDVVFSNLEVGDAIYMDYKLKNFYSGILANHIWDEHYFNYYFPIHKSKYSLLYPKDRILNYKVLHSDLQPTTESINGYTKYSWEMNDVASVKSENYMPELVDVAPILQLSSIDDWDIINKWYASLSNAKADVDYEVQKTVDTLFKDKPQATESEIIKTIYDYVVNEIRYISVPFLQSNHIPQQASNVINTKQGDCKDVSTLFVSMCKAKNIDADLVLVNTSDNGLESMMVPSNMFNHCVARVELDNKEYIVELTDSDLPFSSATLSIENAPTLRINNQLKTNLEQQKMFNSLKRKVVRKSTITFENNEMLVKVLNKKYGEIASNMRINYEHIGPDESFKQLQNSITDDESKYNQLLEYHFTEGLNDVSDEIVYDYTYKQSNPFTEVAGLKIFNIPLIDGMHAVSFINTQERIFPVSIWNYFNYTIENEEVYIKYPTGKSLVENPADVHIKDKYFSYDLTFEKTSDSLIVKRKFELLDIIVTPEDYARFKNNLEQVIKHDNTKIAFQ